MTHDSNRDIYSVMSPSWNVNRNALYPRVNISTKEHHI